MFLEIRPVPGLSVVGKVPGGMEHGGFYINLNHLVFIRFESHTINFYTPDVVFHLYFENEGMDEYRRIQEIILKREILSPK